MSENVRDNSLALAVSGGILTVVSAFLWWHMNADPAIAQPRGRDPGPGFQSGITLVLLGLCSLGLSIASLRQYLRSRARSASALGGHVSAELIKLSAPAAMVVSLVIFVWLAKSIGFLATSILFTVGWALFLTWQDIARSRRAFIVAVLGALAAAGLLYVLFHMVIGIPL